MVSPGERMQEQRAPLLMTRSRFWHPAGVTKRIKMLYESDQRSPKADYLVALDAAGIDVGYVLTGTRSADTTTVGEGEPGAGLSAVAMYDLEAAPGAGRSFDQEAVESTLYFETGALMAQGVDPSRVVGIKVRGDSMDGTLADGDWGRGRHETDLPGPLPPGRAWLCWYLLLVAADRCTKPRLLGWLCGFKQSPPCQIIR